MKRVESTFEMIMLPDESPRPPIRSERAAVVAEMFGITNRLPTAILPPDPYPVEPAVLRAAAARGRGRAARRRERRGEVLAAARAARRGAPRTVVVGRSDRPHRAGSAAGRLLWRSAARRDARAAQSRRIGGSLELSADAV